MNCNLPSPAQSLLCRQTRIVQPALIEEVCGAVWTSGPCQRRDGVDDKANVLFISRFFEATPQGCHARILTSRRTARWFPDCRQSGSNPCDVLTSIFLWRKLSS